MGRLDPAVAAARSAVRGGLADVSAGAPVVVACSGGADSTALLAATLFGARSAGWAVLATVVDHGLQPDSAQVAQAVADRARGLGCLEVEVVTVAVVGPGGPEAAARRARYAALTDVSRSHGDAPVLLGHTLDDQAETVLLGLARGSGARSLAGMAPRSGRFRRPLLGLTRAQTRQACRAERLDVWDDPHNDDPRYARVRVRRDVLPALEAALGPGVAQALARTAALTRDDADLLDALADDLRAAARRAPDRWDVATLAAAPAALRRRVLRAAAIAAGCPPGELFAVHVDAMDRLVTAWHGQQGADLPGRLTASRRGDLLLFRTHPEPSVDPG